MVKTSITGKYLLWSFGLILLIGSFLRLYRICDYMTFLGDEGRDAIVMRDIILGRNFPLIGPGTSIGNMYLGPFYYYLVAPSLLLSGFSPVGPAVFVAVIGILTIALLYWVARQWGIGRGMSLVITALYAVSPVVITYSRSSWNPNVMPFFALLSIYSIWRVYKKSQWNWLIAAAFLFAFVLNSHYLGLLLLPTLGLFWFITKPKSIRHSVTSLLLLLLLLSPLVIFDSAHGWANFNSLKRFLTDRQQTVNLKAYKALPNLWPIWTDINTTLLAAGSKSLGIALSLFIILALTLTLTKQVKSKRISPELILVVSWIGIGVIGLGLYKQHIYAHYFGFLFPAPFLLLGLLTKNINQKSKPVLIGLSLVLLIYNLFNHPFRHEPNRQLARTREIASFIDSQSAGQPFNLALISRYNYDASYRYFLYLRSSSYRQIQEQSTSQLFVICEDRDCQPINSPLYEIAAFGWSKIDQSWSFPWQVQVFRLIPNPSGS